MLPFASPDFPQNSWLNVTVIHSSQIDGHREFIIQSSASASSVIEVVIEFGEPSVVKAA